jgi:hypothetical protein
MTPEEYSLKCKAHLAIMPASEIWRLEHGDEVQREAIATIKAAAGVE